MVSIHFGELMTHIFLVLFVFVPMSLFADIRVDCPQHYGPSETNLVLMIDDESPGKFLSIGYENMGNFFGFKVYDCRARTLSKEGGVFCDGVRIGSLGKSYFVNDDPGYTGPRAQVRLDQGAYVISGSCKMRTLAIEIKKR